MSPRSGRPRCRTGRNQSKAKLPAVLCCSLLVAAAAVDADCIRLLRSMLSNVDELKRHTPIRVSAAYRHVTLTRRRRRSVLITLSTGAARTLFLISATVVSVTLPRCDDVIQREPKRPSNRKLSDSDECLAISQQSVCVLLHETAHLFNPLMGTK